jgi:hypothetical protein
MAGVKVRVAMEGDKELLKKLENLAGDKGARKQLRAATVEVAESKVPGMVEHTPRKTGKLQGSERVKVMVSPKRQEIRIALVAGGPDVPYAYRVHETHKTKSKFVEKTLLEAAQTAAAEIGARIDLVAATNGA